MDAEDGYKAYTGDYPPVEEISKSERLGSKLPLGFQEKTIVELHDTINELKSRLKPILTPVPESAERTQPEDKPSPSQSPLAEQMSANTYGIHEAINKIRALMERLEC